MWRPFSRAPAPEPVRAPVASNPCAAHPTSYHRPALKRVQWHHPTVRAWQRIYTPPNPPFPGVYQGEQLWDARGVWLGPTCHDVVHWWIVEIMHAIHDQLAANAAIADRDAVTAAVATFPKATRRDALFELAIPSPAYFVAVGGELRTLISAGAWGDI